MSYNIQTLLDKIQDAHVLCAGDLMLDCYIYGEATRLSPEAPVPILVVKRQTYIPGGLGNVVMNIHTLGAKALSVGIVGNDSRAQTLINLLSPIMEDKSAAFVRDPTRPTTVKTRVIAGIQQVVRFDEESIEPVSQKIQENYQKNIQQILPRAGALVLSDYGKGLLTPNLTSWLIHNANTQGIPTIVDPKGADYGRYRGATVVTPNRQELSLALGEDITHAPAEILAQGGKTLMERHGIQNLLITRSEDGMTLVLASGKVLHLPTRARAVFDVSGAGDTVVAAVAASLAVGADLEASAKLATLAAAVVVGKVGTATATPTEIKNSESLFVKPS
ncbi:MAG: D-glycero-beta-D-manno-heptose-7-phosphate kinase [Deltaproteobacteria bacterium]|jgi:D-beta-D-heptose 7-phosphate kinase/D-beta-D-heptose 1-phosphate adenosyltransferase|nr:D-glycero-beta-D-manno-heptose-7-phosphate kinase [Deltaproteobacteria bacterium]